jgi:uncharacterized HAD superfamily protein
MRIGLDMDEVLAQFLATFIVYHNEKYNTNHRLEDVHEFELWKVWGGTKEEIAERIRQFVVEGRVLTLPPVPMAQMIIESLKEDNELFVITARHDAGRESSEKWLEEHFPETFREVHMSNDAHKENSSNKTKADICKDIGIDIMIEDSYLYAEGIAAEGIPVILLNYSWNISKPHTDNIFRARDWSEVPKVISSIMKNDQTV